MSQTNREIADKIAAAIFRSGRSLNSVATESGIPRTTFQRKINGTTPWTVEELAAVGDVLGVKPSSFLPDRFALAEAS
ncbi:helix-turn-helix domain-containing protein [Arthrobacter woluwensis]|uniref:Winged helix-turn-helix DNA-binding n=1 Tax=Arthrobacter woluwensis TaxID=156980 RepID=A0A1H4W7H0_9MICC|nr:helix-turn-helix domain-containing protein [Arthrobacter woluwensis]SEC89266.1 Winged helix-turn-helix DNA-binding [Arthrobacter woluwensis]